MNTIPGHSGSPAQGGRETGNGTPERPIGVDDAARLLEVAGHDIAVASACIGLGDLDEAHTSVLTARVAVDAVEEILRMLLEGGMPGGTA
jgi:hypothetical protein